MVFVGIAKRLRKPESRVRTVALSKPVRPCESYCPLWKWGVGGWHSLLSSLVYLEDQMTCFVTVLWKLQRAT